MTGQLKVKRYRGLITAWLEEGESNGPILIFLHGYPDSPEIWDPQVEAFTARYLCVRPYARGIAPSEPGRSLKRYGLGGSALDHLAILKSMDPSETRPVVVVGHDLGAVHAIHLARCLKDRVKGLVVFNGLSLDQMVGRLKTADQALRSWYIYLFCLPFIPEKLLARFPISFHQIAHSLGGFAESAAPIEQEALKRVRWPLKQYRAFLSEIPRYGTSRFPRLQCPTLVIWGKNDPFLSIPENTEWERIASDVTLRILEGGHWVYREKPEETNRILDEFFSRCLPSMPGLQKSA